MKRKSVFMIMVSLCLWLGVGSCSDDKDPGGEELLGSVSIYNSGEKVYSGDALSPGVQYATVDGAYMDCTDILVAVNGGTVTITLPGSPSDDALFDGKGFDEDASGIDMAHYSFEGIGIGKSYAEASHLELYWFKEDVGDIPSGWYWMDADYRVYASLQEAVDAGNKVYVSDLITYTVSAEGAMSSDALIFTFDGEIHGFEKEHVRIYPKTGQSVLERGEDGGEDSNPDAGTNRSARNIEIPIITDAAGEVTVLVDKWGVSRKAVTVLVEYTPANTIQPSDRYCWMKNIPDTWKLNQLRIPGTHDSGTYKYLFHGAVKCQNASISQQLNDGIRFLDIRVGYGGVIYHGDFTMGITVVDVVDDCISFLKKNPSETIIIMLAQEGVTYLLPTWRGWLEQAFTGSRAGYWYLNANLSQKDTTLGDVRGKMVVVNGDDTGKTGFSYGWLISQNDWDIGNAYMSAEKRGNLKVGAIIRFNNEAFKNSNTFTVYTEKYYERNFANWLLGRYGEVDGYKSEVFYYANDRILRNNWNKRFNVGASVLNYANYINAQMKKNVWEYPRGIQVMDYYDQTNVDRIIDSNF